MRRKISGWFGRASEKVRRIRALLEIGVRWVELAGDLDELHGYISYMGEDALDRFLG
jgi:hypothetical protein